MTHLIMETRVSYCVALDEAGRFLKVANKNYEVGEVVEHVVPLTQTQARSIPLRAAAALGSLAACLVMAFTLYWSSYMAPFASVYLSINPEVRIQVNRQDAVVGLEGLNEDGGALIEGYSYRNKPLGQATDELVGRAVELGFLSEGGKVTVSIDAPDEAWFTDTGIALRQSLSERLADSLSVTVEVKKFREQEAEPATAPTPEPTPAPATPKPATPKPVTPEPIQYSGDDDDSDDDDDENDNDTDDDRAERTARPTTRPTRRPSPPKTHSPQPTQAPQPATPKPVRDDDVHDDGDDDDSDDGDDDDERQAFGGSGDDDDDDDDDDRQYFSSANDDNSTDYNDYSSGGNTGYNSGGNTDYGDGGNDGGNSTDYDDD